jgi:hypothetical protein
VKREVRKPVRHLGAVGMGRFATWVAPPRRIPVLEAAYHGIVLMALSAGSPSSLMLTPITLVATPMWCTRAPSRGEART